jgi:DNA-binding MarR family transcriptional regulator
MHLARGRPFLSRATSTATRRPSDGMKKGVSLLTSKKPPYGAVGGMWRAGGAGMHPLSYLHKRVHLSAVATGRRMFARVSDMTPARFDVLYVLYEHRRRWGVVWPMWQAEIRRALGLRRQTVWKLVVRLQELGLLRKLRATDGDRRKIVVELTNAGLERIKQAYGAAFTESYPPPPGAPLGAVRPRYERRIEREDAIRRGAATVGREVAKVFTTFSWRKVGRRRRGRTYRHLERLESMILDARAIAKAFGDTSALVYPLGYESDH